MSLWVIIPVKPLEEGKSRLAGVLSGEQRSALTRAMLEHALKALGEVKSASRLLVVSRDADVLALAQRWGAETLPEDCPPELNASLAYATRFAREHGASMTLVLPADLPLVTAADLQALVEHAPAEEGIVIAPDRRREGTNALLTRPAGAIAYRYGPDSFRRHCQEARQRGLRVIVCEREGLALDIDLPEDLAYLEGHGAG